MNPKLLVFITIILTILVFLAGAMSELSLLTKENGPDDLGQIVGLPSTTVGNLNPSARNPGVELLCPGLFDAPGGYCSYFASGVPIVNFTVIIGVTENSTGEK